MTTANHALPRTLARAAEPRRWTALFNRNDKNLSWFSWPAAALSTLGLLPAMPIVRQAFNSLSCTEKGA